MKLGGETKLGLRKLTMGPAAEEKQRYVQCNLMRQKSCLASGGKIIRLHGGVLHTSKPCMDQIQHNVSHNMSVRSVRGINPE